MYAGKCNNGIQLHHNVYDKAIVSIQWTEELL